MSSEKKVVAKTEDTIKEQRNDDRVIRFGGASIDVLYKKAAILINSYY